MFWTKKNSHKLNTNMKIKTTWATIIAFFAMDIAKENVLTEEHVDKLEAELNRLQAVETKVANLEKENVTMKSALAETERQFDAHKASTSAISAENETLKAENAELKKNAGADTAHANSRRENTSSGKTDSVVKDDASFEENMASVAKHYGIVKKFN